MGEIANFTAYAFAPAVLVTPLGALSIIVRFASDPSQSKLVGFLVPWIHLTAMFWKLGLQCDSGTCGSQGAIAFAGDSRLRALYSWVHDNCATCTSRTRH